jgi:chitodextrinase
MLHRVVRNFLAVIAILNILATISLMAADEKTPQSQGLSAAPAAPTAITLNWTAPGDDSLSGTAAQYDVRYSTSLITSANFAAASQATGETAPKAPGQSETFTVTGLTPGTLYYFAIKTADEAGNWSAISNVVSATTTDNVPPASIKNLTAN